MELLQLKYFCDAVETENFSKTAEKFIVPPSAISQSIKRLERELGHKLFIRNANKIIVSPEGKAFYDGVKLAIDSLEQAKNKLNDFSDVVCGKIRIFIGTNRRYVTEIIEKYHELYPQVTFYLNHDFVSSVNDFDLIITDDGTRFELEKTFLLKEKILVCMNANNELCKKQNLSLLDLKEQKFISMHSKSSLFSSTYKMCLANGFAPDTVIQTDDPFYIRKYVSLGLGVAFFPEFSWKGLSDGLVLKDFGEHYRITYIYHKNINTLPVSVKLFLDMLIKFINK